MTVTLHLRPEIEAGLSEQARARGMALEEYLLWLAEDASGFHSQESDFSGATRENAVKRMLEFGDRYRLTLGELVSRKMLHEGPVSK